MERAVKNLGSPKYAATLFSCPHESIIGRSWHASFISALMSSKVGVSLFKKSFD